MSDQEQTSGSWSRTRTLAVCALILLAAGGLTMLIFSTEPRATREGATRESAMLVETVPARMGTYTPVVKALGTVRPAREIILRPRVGGEVLDRADAFSPGGLVKKGEVLLRLDPADYENTLRRRRSELRRAEADLRLEEGRQAVARRDYALLDEELSVTNRALVLREPQMQTARADVEAARAAVDQAELELARTTLRAPFDALVLHRTVNVGSQVAAGDELARLVGVDPYWVEATVPLSKLSRLAFPAQGAPGAAVRVRNPTAWAPGTVREGRLYRRIGEVDERTRLARVLVEVPDPLALEAGGPARPALMIGAYVEAHMQARPIEGAVRLDRDYVHQGDTVWVMKDGALDIREVTVAFEDAEAAYITEGLADGERVVITHLATVVEGASLREEAAGDEDAGTSPAGEGD